MSLTPRSTKSRASLIICKTGLETSAPRVKGTTQNAQNLSHPSWTVKKAEGALLALRRS